MVVRVTPGPCPTPFWREGLGGWPQSGVGHRRAAPQNPRPSGAASITLYWPLFFMLRSANLTSI